MNKLKTIIDLVNKGDKAKLWKYLNRGIYSKKDKIDVMKNSTYSGGGNSGDSTVKEGDLLYYTISDVSLNSIRDITDNITQIAVGRGENMNTASIIYLDSFIDIQEVTIEKGDDYVVISTSNYNVIDMPAFVYKVGSDLKTAEDIVGNSSITRITKDEYDDIFTA